MLPPHVSERINLRHLGRPVVWELVHTILDVDHKLNHTTLAFSQDLTKIADYAEFCANGDSLQWDGPFHTDNNKIYVNLREGQWLTIYERVLL